jgi:hypothetical protein
MQRLEGVRPMIMIPVGVFLKNKKTRISFTRDKSYKH